MRSSHSFWSFGSWIAVVVALVAAACGTPDLEPLDALDEQLAEEETTTSMEESELLGLCLPEHFLCLPLLPCCGDAVCHQGFCTNPCGNGVVEPALGEACDDGNTVNGDGCDASCQLEFETTPPIEVSGGVACTTAEAGLARKIAVDDGGTIYAIMRCGTAANLVVSTDRGRSFSAPLDLARDLEGLNLRPVSHVAVVAGPRDVAHVAIMLSNARIFVRTTLDRGATWSAGVLIGSTTLASVGLSMAAFEDDVYVGFRSSNGVAVARNHSRGAGPFELTNVEMQVSFFDLALDSRSGTLAVFTETPAFHLRVSGDGGVTFAPEVNPPGSQLFSDCAIGASTIFVAGSAGNGAGIYLIPSAAPSTSTFVTGIPATVQPQTRSISADAVGNAYVASQLNSGGVQLDRLPAGAAAFDAPRLIDPAGAWPIASALPGGSGAAVIYTVGSSVWVTVQAY